MRILGLFLNERAHTGGHLRYLELLRGLAARGHRVTLVTGLRTQLSDALLVMHRDASTSFDVLRITVEAPLFSLRPRVSLSHLWLRSVSRSEDSVLRQSGLPEVVCVFGENKAVAGARLAAAAGCPLVVGLRSNMKAELDVLGTHRSPMILAPLLGAIEARVLESRERRVAEAASRVIFQTDFDRDDFLQRHPEVGGKTAVIPNNLEPSWFDPIRRDTNTSTGVRHLVFVGTLNRRKGVLTLLEAVRRLVHEEGYDIRLKVLGTGPLRGAVTNMVRSYRLEETVDLLGQREDSLETIARSDLLVLPSLFDSFPNVLLEALHVGTPAVATRVGGIPEILGADGELVNPGDAAALTAAVRRLIDDPTAYERAKASMIDRRQAFEFDWVGRFENAIREAVEGG